jgi:hypothetical protein
MTPVVSNGEVPPTYPARDYLCLDCVVAGGCNPQSQLCLWRADHSARPDEREVRARYLEPGRRVSRW